MTLTGAGPLVGIVDADDKHHGSCVAELPGLSVPMVTPWPCFTEAMYLLGEVLGVRRVFTVDSDFVVYRLPGKLAFEIVP